MDVVDDHIGGATPGERDVGEDAGESGCSCHVPLVFHALHGARGEEGEDESEAGDKHAGEGVDDGQLFEEDSWRGEGGDERHVLTADAVGIGDEEVGETGFELPPFDVLQLDRVAARCHAARQLLHLAAKEEAHFGLGGAAAVAAGGAGLQLHFGALGGHGQVRNDLQAARRM